MNAQRYPSCFASLLLVGSLLAAWPSDSWAIAPVVNGPVVASMTPGSGVSVTVAGSGFLQGYFPQIIFTGALNLTITYVDPNNLDPRIRKWTDDQILVDGLPESALKASVKVKHASGTSATSTVGYLYDWTTIPDGGSNGSPLALAIGDPSVLWINQEFHTTLYRLDLGTGLVTGAPTGTHSVFEINYLGQDLATNISQNGEDVQVDRNGRAWFSEGGAWLFERSATSWLDNHSRIVRFDATGTALTEYNVPGDNNQIMGLALDPDPSGNGPDLVWYSTIDRDPYGWRNYNNGFHTRLVSFHPQETTENGIAASNDFDFTTANLSCNKVGTDVVGTCSATNADISFKTCVSNADCVNASLLCAPNVFCNSVSDMRFFHEYEFSPLTTDTVQIGHLLVDRRTTQKNIWFTGSVGKNLYYPPPNYNPSRLGRLIIDSSGSHIEEYPLADLAAGTSFPWQLIKSPAGDIVFTEHARESIGKFDNAYVGSSSTCTALVNGVNPCITERIVPAADPAVHFVHSITYDKSNNLWFTLGTGNDMRSNIGFLKPDWNTFVMLPAISAFFVTTNADSACGPPAGQNIPASSAGIVTDPKLGDVWVADYCRKNVGRFRDASSATDLSWYVSVGADDGFEDNTDTSPSKPKLSQTILKLESVGVGGKPKSLVGVRLTSQGGVSGRALTAHLVLPIQSSSINRFGAIFQISVGVPNDAAFNANAYGDLSNRTKLATMVNVTKDIPGGTTSISFDTEVAKLMDVAQRDPAWLTNQTNVVPIYIGRVDTQTFTVNGRSWENSHSETVVINGIRGGA